MTATMMEKMDEEKVLQNTRPVASKLLKGYLHKTSNSICGIKGYAGLIAANASSSNSASRWAKKILAEIERMEEIFRSVGDLNIGTTSFRSGCDIPGVLNRAVSETQNKFPGLNVTISSLPAGQLLLPEADLKLVLNEILGNSAEASEKATVKICAQVEITGRVVLCLTDQGPGMSPELLGQAIDPFVTTREAHHGMGLTRVETILDMHRLAWSLVSHQGVGTTVTLEVAEALILNPEIV